MADTQKVRIVSEGIKTRIYIDGTELKGVYDYTLTHRALSPARLSVNMRISELELELEDATINLRNDKEDK